MPRIFNLATRNSLVISRQPKPETPCVLRYDFRLTLPTPNSTESDYSLVPSLHGTPAIFGGATRNNAPFHSLYFCTLMSAILVDGVVVKVFNKIDAANLFGSFFFLLHFCRNKYFTSVSEKRKKQVLFCRFNIKYQKLLFQMTEEM